MLQFLPAAVAWDSRLCSWAATLMDVNADRSALDDQRKQLQAPLSYLKSVATRKGSVVAKLVSFPIHFIRSKKS